MLLQGLGWRSQGKHSSTYSSAAYRFCGSERMDHSIGIAALVDRLV